MCTTWERGSLSIRNWLEQENCEQNACTLGPLVAVQGEAHVRWEMEMQLLKPSLADNFLEQYKQLFVNRNVFIGKNMVHEMIQELKHERLKWSSNKALGDSGNRA